MVLLTPLMAHAEPNIVILYSDDLDADENL